MQHLSKAQYAAYVQSLEPPSRLGRDVCLAFVTGGAICALAQLIGNGWAALGLDRDTAGAMTSVALIFLGALLTGLSVFDDIARYAGAGTLVPITGFSNAIVASAMEFRSEGLVLGMSGKMFTIAGPVLVFGISASVVYGVILWLIGLG